MRIAHITATFPPHTSGTGNVCYHNARELVRRGHEVHVFTAQLPGLAPDEQTEGMHVHRLRPLLRYGNAYFLPTLFLKLRSFDLVHLHMPFYGGCEAVLLQKQLHGVPLVITHHQDVHLSKLLGLVSRSHDRLIGQPLMRAADRACFTSRDYANTSQYRSLVSTGRLHVAELPNGVAPEHFTPGERPVHLVQRYALENRPVLLFVGALDRAHYFKGVGVLLQALAWLGRPDVALIIVGAGDLRSSYQQRTAQLGLAEQVYFPGYVPDAELPDYYRLADVTILPSTTTGEAFGLVLLESLACGTPVIASNLPGVRTVVDEGRDGVLVEPGDVAALAGKLQFMLALPASERQEMGCAGRHKVEERYAWEKIGVRLEALYRQVLDGHPEDAAQHVEIQA